MALELSLMHKLHQM